MDIDIGYWRSWYWILILDVSIGYRLSALNVDIDSSVFGTKSEALIHQTKVTMVVQIKSWANRKMCIVMIEFCKL